MEQIIDMRWLMHPLQTVRDILAAQRARLREQRRALALVRIRDGLATLGHSTEDLTDDELEALCNHVGLLANRMIEAKTLAMSSIFFASEQAVRVIDTENIHGRRD